MSTEKNTQGPATNSFTLTAGAAKYLADAMLAAVSKDEVTPVICAARITIANGRLRGIATDRYRVHMVNLETEGKAEDQAFTIGRDLLTWLSKNAGVFSRRTGANILNPIVTIETREPGAESHDHGVCHITIRRDASLSHDVLKMSGTLVRGNFPPLHKLVDTAREAETTSGEVMLNLDFLASMRALSPDKTIVPKIRFTKSENPNKPAPVYLSWGMNPVIAEAILQPNLNLR